MSAYASVAAPHYSSLRQRNVLSINCGNNDYAQGTTDPTVIYSRILSYVSAAQGTGFSVVVVTVLSTSAIPNSTRVTLNGLITGGAVANGYTVADAGADAIMGCDGCYANTTYFQAGGVHPTVVGHAIVATYVESALSALGFH